MMARKWCNNFN